MRKEWMNEMTLEEKAIGKGTEGRSEEEGESDACFGKMNSLCLLACSTYLLCFALLLLLLAFIVCFPIDIPVRCCCCSLLLLERRARNVYYYYCATTSEPFDLYLSMFSRDK